MIRAATPKGILDIVGKLLLCLLIGSLAMTGSRSTSARRWKSGCWPSPSDRHRAGDLARRRQLRREGERALDRLIVLADVGMRAQHRIHRLEHVAHARLRHRALDHHHQLGLVR